MAHLYRETGVKSLYSDRKFNGGKQGWREALSDSTTLYIGNLSFYTTEDQLYELFSRCGEVKRVVMGLDRNSKTPCGFCFVEYHTKADTSEAVRNLSGSKLDERIIRVDWDAGFVEGRQYGRGRSGGQVRDEYRTDYDVGRGGWGKGEDQQATLQANRPRQYSRGPRRDGYGGPPAKSLPPIRQQSQPTAPADEQAPAKRQKASVEANPRFREGKEDDDEDD